MPSIETNPNLELTLALSFDHIGWLGDTKTTVVKANEMI